MDLKLFYKKIREAESSLMEDYVVTVSLATADGGKSGVFAEVPKRLAAVAVVEGKARLATEEEASTHRAEVRAAHKAIEERLLAGQARFSVIAENELKALRAAMKPVR